MFLYLFLLLFHCDSLSISSFVLFFPFLSLYHFQSLYPHRSVFNLLSFPLTPTLSPLSYIFLIRFLLSSIYFSISFSYSISRLYFLIHPLLQYFFYSFFLTFNLYSFSPSLSSFMSFSPSRLSSLFFFQAL